MQEEKSSKFGFHRVYSDVMGLAKKKLGTAIDPALHRKLRLVSSVTGRKIEAIVEDALRAALADYPSENFTTFEEMHARYERLHGRIDIAAEAAAMTGAKSGRGRRD